MPDELARAVGVEKRFGDLVAVKSASVAFHAGRIHAVCGENGAGKSTLLKVVAGMLVPDAGHVTAFGSTLEPHTPREAIRRGVGMVLQHFALVPVFTALDNIVLGAEPVSAGGVIDLEVARARAERVAKDLGVAIPLDALVETLGVGDRQRLEIARTLFRDAKLLILDEPTAVLTKSEARALYKTLRRLADAGTGVVVVTHKMDEVRENADVVTVLRKGQLVFTKDIRGGDADPGKTDIDARVAEVTAAIMGVGKPSFVPESVRVDPRDRTPESDEDAITLEGVTVGRSLTDVSFAVKRGEIVGVAGVEGNGQRELVDVIAGDLPLDAGKVTGGPAAIVREDRQTDGLVLDASLRDNVLLGELGSFSNAIGILDLGAVEAEAKRRIEGSGAPNDLERSARTLSGGNQQKIVVARALARLDAGEARSPLRALVAAQPTRGVDLGASTDIHAKLRSAARAGVGVLVLSADLDELRALCNRILVIARGRIVADLPPDASDEDLGRRMLGLEAREAPRSEAGP